MSHLNILPAKMYENVINYCTEFKYKLFVQSKPPVLNLQLFTNPVIVIKNPIKISLITLEAHSVGQVNLKAIYMELQLWSTVWNFKITIKQY